jgi:hypothetical protein
MQLWGYFLAPGLAITLSLVIPTPYLITRAIKTSLFQSANEPLYISVLALISTIFISQIALILFAYKICKVVAREAVGGMLQDLERERARPLIS